MATSPQFTGSRNEQQAITTPKQLYEALQKEHPQELAEQMKLFHLTPEMMNDQNLTASKYIDYIAKNNIDLPKEQMRQIMNLAKMEEQYRMGTLQNNTQWTNRSNITSSKKGSDLEWRSRVPEVFASADANKANSSYNTLRMYFSQYKDDKEGWITNYKEHEQIKAIADALNIKVDVEKLIEHENALMATLKRHSSGEIPQKTIKRF